MPTMRISAIKIGPRFRVELGDLSALAASIKAIGLLHEVIVTGQGDLVCGRRRVEACRSLGWKDIPCRVVDIDHLIAERDENECRKDFTVSERVAIAKAIEEREKPEAAKRKQSTQTKGGDRAGAPKLGSEKFTEPSESDADEYERYKQRRDEIQQRQSQTTPLPKRGEAADIAARAAGFSRPTYEKAKEVVEAAKEEPEKFADLKEQMDLTGKVDPAHKEMERRKAGAEPQERPYDVMDDVAKITAFIERLRKNWTKDEHKTVIQHCLRQLAKDI